jgi:hypothetical protein
MTSRLLVVGGGIAGFGLARALALRDLVAPVLGPGAYRQAYGPLRAPVAQAVTGG